MTTNNGDLIPRALREQAGRWLLWSLRTEHGGKPSKRPEPGFSSLKPGLDYAALASRPRTEKQGIGFIFKDRLLIDGYTLVALDLDACVDPTNGAVAQWAVDILGICGNSYTETSPSGTGLRVFVLVRRMPDRVIRATRRLPWPPSPNVHNKTPEVQLFGLGPAGYVTVTGDRIEEVAAEIMVIESLDPLIEMLQLETVETATPPESDTPAPPTAEIKKSVLAKVACGQQLLDAEWTAATPNKSASEAFQMLERLVLEATGNRLRASLDFLLHFTAWGRGEVEDSKDPGRYASPRWVLADLKRTLAKMPEAPSFSTIEGNGHVEPTAPVPTPTQPAARVLKLVSVADLAERPRPRDLWARMLPAGGLAVWYGAPKCGKSYLALGLGLAIAEGKPFLGRDTIVELVEKGGVTERRGKPGTVIYIAGEGVNGIVDKVAATIGPARARDRQDPIHQRFLVLPEMPHLTDPKGMQTILVAIKELNVQADLVIVDTMARALGAAGLDENSTEDMGKMVAALDRLRAETGAAVLGPHHANKSGVDRGSSALRGAADVFAKVERARPRVSRLVVEDMRDGEPAAPIEITWGNNVVARDEHGPVARWFVLSFKDTEKDVDPSADEEVIRVLRAADGPSHRLDVQEELGISKAEACRRLKRLRKSGKIQQLGHGRDARYIESSPSPSHGDGDETKGRSDRLVSSPPPKGGDARRSPRRRTNRLPKQEPGGNP